MSPQAAQTATETLLNLGLPGVVILGLVAALLYQVRRNDTLRDKNDALNESHRVALEALNELRLKDRDMRLEDQRSNAKVILEVTDRYRETILSVKDEMKDLKEEVQAQRPRGAYR